MSPDRHAPEAVGAGILLSGKQSGGWGRTCPPEISSPLRESRVLLALSEPRSRGSALPPLVLLPALSDFSPLPWAASVARRKRGLQISEVFQSVLHLGSPGSSWGPQPLPVPPTQAGIPGAQTTHRVQGASHLLRAARLLPSVTAESGATPAAAPDTPGQSELLRQHPVHDVSRVCLLDLTLFSWLFYLVFRRRR